VDEQIIEEISRALQERHADEFVAISAEAWYEFAEMLALLPETGQWAVCDRSPGIWVRSKRVHFTVLIDIEHNRVNVHSRRSDPRKLAIALRWGASTSDGASWARVTEWTIRDDNEGVPEDERVVAINGTITTRADGAKRFDHNERCAREIAHDAGWAAPPSAASKLSFATVSGAPAA
jgi:hypothetical protein